MPYFYFIRGAMLNLSSKSISLLSVRINRNKTKILLFIFEKIWAAVKEPEKDVTPKMKRLD